MASPRIQSLAARLNKEVINKSDPAPGACLDLMRMVSKESSLLTISILEKTEIGKLLTRSLRHFKRHKRAGSGEAQKSWQEAIDLSNKVLRKWETLARKGEKQNPEKKSDGPSINLPEAVAEYRSRLVAHKKELFKDPPVLPPSPISIEERSCAFPTRDKETGELTFVANDPAVKAALKDFHPNVTPEEVLRQGSFGGTYFRSITSSVTNVSYNGQEVLKDTVPNEWINGLFVEELLTSQKYRPQVNKFGVKCGGSLGMWESSGWITSVDPYGWFQWYCRFYQGRRCSDDARQISRWLKSAGPKGRFRSQLCNKILAAQTTHDDVSISPVIRQTLLHWGLLVTPSILQIHRERVGG